MPTVIIPHRDPNKAGATEHVDAIIQSLRKGVRSQSVIVADPIESRYEEEDFGLLAQLEQIKAKYGDAEYIVATGDYGADRLSDHTSVADTFKTVLGKNTQVLLSSYTVESITILDALDRGSINYLSIPRHAVKSEVLEGMPAEQVINNSREKLIEMTAVPHNLGVNNLADKYREWSEATKDGTLKPLPEPDKRRSMIAVIIPGDVEDGNGRPKLFTEKDARELAKTIAQRIKTTPNALVMISNGPRTGKYNEALFDAPNFNPNNPAFQNRQRMDSIDHNPVVKVFIHTLKEYVTEDNIILGCIEKGKVPPQGFLAFYDVLNRQATSGGHAELYIDGVFTTMMAQAANVLDPHVQIIACDTPAKNKTHIAGVQDLLDRGYIDAQLSLQNAEYVFVPGRVERSKKKFDDAALVAGRITKIVNRNQSAGEHTKDIMGTFTE